MKVLLAKNAGFCMGVRRAVDTTLATLEEGNRKIATFGPLIHNPQVLDLLRDRGVAVLKSIPERLDGTVIIRAHGVPPEQKKKLQQSGAAVKDATCPRVVKVQVIIDKYRKRGVRTVIIGDRNHAEVEGLMGYAGSDVLVVSGLAEIDGLDLAGPYIVVCQTTQNERSFEEISARILEKYPEGKVFNTICDSTHKRQEEVRDLCRQVDAMVVVGGRTSANTARLGEIAGEMGCPVFMVERESDLDLAALSRYPVIGVTAGASTPSWMINLVVQVLESVPVENEGTLKPWLFRIFWTMLSANLTAALAAGLLALAAVCLLAIPFDWRYPLLATGYIFSMHNLNRFTAISAKKINDPVKAYFAIRNRRPLFSLSLISLAGSLAIAYSLGTAPLVAMTLLSAGGLLYSGHLLSGYLPKIPLGRVRQLPGSKTLLVSLAWAVAAVLVPAMAAGGTAGVRTAATFAALLLFVHVRCAMFDIADLNGDRIVGKETLPVVIGEARTHTLLNGLLCGLLVLLLLLPLGGWLPPAAWGMMPAVLALGWVNYRYRRQRLVPGPRFEMLVDGTFLLLAAGPWLVRGFGG
ncbi:MAG: 4-hydroxy-3-methylbut-2-enyl diphosphate reductase [Thermodesulfobacteriota bacterium]